MPQSLTTQEIDALINTVTSQGVNGAIDVYSLLYSKGYGYAGWARGVASGNTLTGQTAIDYLKGSAMMGLGSEACQNLTESDMNSIRMGMALGYLGMLKQISFDGGGVVSRDVSFSEARDFHVSVFDDNGLSIDNWTLEIPMKIISLEHGDLFVENLWQDIRESGGDGFDGVLESANLMKYVLDAKFTSENNYIRDIANLWTEVVSDPVGLTGLKFGKLLYDSFDIAGMYESFVNEFDLTVVQTINGITTTFVVGSSGAGLYELNVGTTGAQIIKGSVLESDGTHDVVTSIEVALDGNAITGIQDLSFTVDEQEFQAKIHQDLQASIAKMVLRPLYLNTDALDHFPVLGEILGEAPELNFDFSVQTVPLLDEFGNPILDASGNPKTQVMAYHYEALDDSGDYVRAHVFGSHAGGYAIKSGDVSIFKNTVLM